MIIAVSSGLYVIYNDILFRQVQGLELSERKYNVLSALLNAVTSALCALSLTISAHPLYEELFSILFGLQAILLVPGLVMDIVFLRKVALDYDRFRVKTDLAWKVRRYLIAGLIVASISTLSWTIPENVCKLIDNSAKYLFWSHGLWHVGMAYALITISQSIVFIHLVEIEPKIRNEITDKVLRNKFTFQDGEPSCLSRFFFTIFLVVQPHNQQFDKDVIVFGSDFVSDREINLKELRSASRDPESEKADPKKKSQTQKNQKKEINTKK
jgi:hypothetical protein